MHAAPSFKPSVNITRLYDATSQKTVILISLLISVFWIIRPTRLHEITIKKTTIYIFTAVRTSNLVIFWIASNPAEIRTRHLPIPIYYLAQGPISNDGLPYAFTLFKLKRMRHVILNPCVHVALAASFLKQILNIDATATHELQHGKANLSVLL
jgi:hypothetical protein